jgi:outer membrane lipoprotein-sorting protein
VLKHLLAALALIGVAAAGPQPAAATSSVVPTDARSVITRMTDLNPSLQSYRARVHVDVRMLNFPFLAPKLDGTSYYRRPDTYEVVFDRVPSYAKGFEKLFNDIGDPLAWEKDQNITVDGVRTIDGRATIVLRLTKKIHSTILDHTLAYVDAASYALMRMEWYYTSGGKITMSQQYGKQGMYWVPASQHADIDIPHVHAVADAQYGSYQTNVAVDSTIPSTP